MLNKVNVSKDGKVCFVLADDLEPEDFVGKYVYPYADLLINIYLENVQLRDSFEGKVYEELLPFQRFCVDQYKSMKDRVVNYIEFNEIGYGYGFIIYDHTNDTRAVTLHEWIRDNVDGTAWHLRSIQFGYPIPGTFTNYLIPSNVRVSNPSVKLGEAIRRNEYKKRWMDVKLNPFEFGVYMDKTFYGKTPFHIENYFGNGGKSISKIIDNDLYR